MASECNIQNRDPCESLHGLPERSMQLQRGRKRSLRNPVALEYQTRTVGIHLGRSVLFREEYRCSLLGLSDRCSQVQLPFPAFYNSNRQWRKGLDPKSAPLPDVARPRLTPRCAYLGFDLQQERLAYREGEKSLARHCHKTTFPSRLNKPSERRD